MIRLLGVLFFLFIAMICIISLLIHAFYTPKYRCKGCSNKVDATQIVCKHCGTFVDHQQKQPGKMIKYIDKREDNRIQDNIKKGEFK